MRRYYVEGLYIARKNLNKAMSGGQPRQKYVELLAQSFWANSPDEALIQAIEALGGGQWMETPKVSLTSEEQRMRNTGEAELPGLMLKESKKKNKQPGQQ